MQLVLQAIGCGGMGPLLWSSGLSIETSLQTGSRGVALGLAC